MARFVVVFTIYALGILVLNELILPSTPLRAWRDRRAAERVEIRNIRDELALSARGHPIGIRVTFDAVFPDDGDYRVALPGNARASLAAFRAARGAVSEARALARRVESEAVLNHHAAYGLGAAHAQLRDSPAAVRWLSQAARTGWRCYPWYARDPLLDPIREDAQFADFMRGLHRTLEEARAKYGRVVSTK